MAHSYSPFEDSPRKTIELPLLSQPLSRNQFNSDMNKIGDPSFVLRPPLSLFEKVGRYLDDKSPTIPLESPVTLFWASLNFFLIYANVISVPILLSFQGQTAKRGLDMQRMSLCVMMNWLSVPTFIADALIFQPSLRYFQGQKLIKSRAMILKRNFPRNLLLNVAAVISIVASSCTSLSLFKLLFVVKIVSLIEFDKLIRRNIINKYLYACYCFLRIIFLVYFITTLVACIYFSIDLHYYNERGGYYDKNLLWLTNSATIDSINILDNFQWYQWYLYALYWAAQTTSGVGYGDITPKNPHQVLFCNLVMLFKILLFIFFVNTVLDIADQLQEDTTLYLDRKKALAEFIQDYPETEPLRKKVDFYLQELQATDSNDIEAKLPARLKRKFRATYYTDIFTDFSLFETIIFSYSLRADLAAFVTKCTSSPREVIFTSQSPASLYYLQKGKVVLSSNHDQFPSTQIILHSHFGSQAFFLTGRHSQTATGEYFCRMYTIRRDHFLQTLKTHSLTYEVFRQYIEDMQMEKSKHTELINLKCKVCQRYHLTSHCPYMAEWKTNMIRAEVELCVIVNGDSPRQPFPRPRHRSLKIINKPRGGMVEIDSVHQYQRYRRDFNMF